MKERNTINTTYPVGTRIRLINMDCPGSIAVPSGSIGTVLGVDDAGVINMQWDNGSFVGLIAGKDEFEIVERMTTEEFKTHLSEAGKCFIEEMADEDYLTKWFGSEKLDDGADDRIISRMIRLYNRHFEAWLVTDSDSEQYLANKAFNEMIGMLRFIKAVNYYDVSEYGDITPFTDYCRCCWKTLNRINLNEYELIRWFVVGQGYIKM